MGALENIIVIALGLLVIVIVRCVKGYESAEKKRAMERYEREDEEEERYMQAQLELFLSKVDPLLTDFYSDYVQKWCRPDDPLNIDLLRYPSEAEIKKAQVDNPDEWFRWADQCECWVDNGVFYLLQTIQSVEEFAQPYPNVYDTPEKIEKRVVHYAIPIESIHFYKLKGEMIRSTKVIREGSATYRGASVNGIGFGEIETTPAITVPRVISTQYVALYYQNGNKVDCLCFTDDAVDMLSRLFPQLERD